MGSTDPTQRFYQLTEGEVRACVGGVELEPANGPWTHLNSQRPSEAQSRKDQVRHRPARAQSTTPLPPRSVAHHSATGTSTTTAAVRRRAVGMGASSSKRPVAVSQRKQALVQLPLLMPPARYRNLIQRTRSHTLRLKTQRHPSSVLKVVKVEDLGVYNAQLPTPRAERISPAPVSRACHAEAMPVLQRQRRYCDPAAAFAVRRVRVSERVVAHLAGRVTHFKHDAW